MSIFDRRNRRDLDQLVEEYVTTNNINRRQFLKRATAAGLSISSASALLAACGGGNAGVNGTSGTPTKVNSIDALTEWSGEELDSFNAINAAFTQKTGIKVNVESTRDLPAVLTTRIKGNNPPDVCGMPDISTFHKLSSEGKLLQLDKFFDMSQYQQNYGKAWVDFASTNGHMYGVLPKVNSKGTIWYNPDAFKAAGVTVPQTWNDLISVSDKLANSGKYPWAMGVESGASSGWPAADWIAQIYLNQSGPDMYDKWWSHKIPWTDNSIKQAFQAFGQIVSGKHYINGAPQAILSTGFQDASYLPFDNPPKAYMYYLGDFAAGFITSQFKGIQAGKGYGFFPFPTINPQYKGAVTGSADILGAFKDNDGTRQYMEFVSTAAAQTIWVKRGGASSANKSVDPASYPDDIARAAAQQLVQATTFKFGADDQMPGAMEDAFWKATLTFIGAPSQLDSILRSLESTAQQTYS